MAGIFPDCATAWSLAPGHLISTTRSAAALHPSRLARIHERSGRDREYVDASARLLDIEAAELDPDTLVTRTLALTHDLVTRVDRLVDATRRLEGLARDFPQRPQVHERTLRQQHRDQRR